MSYDITFMKRKDLNVENVYDALEAEVDSTSEYFISPTERTKLAQAIESLGLKLEKFESDHSIEYSSESYQVMIFDSQIAVAMPYWDANETDGVISEIKEVMNLLVQKGYTGFDSQTEEFITTEYNLKKSFTESKTVADTVLKHQETVKPTNWPLIGLGLVAVIALIWYFTKK